MSSESVLLSVVVPTRNRAKYALGMLDSILCIDSNEFELVISDNSDDDLLESYVKGLDFDKRLKYQRVPGVLSMTENHNLAFGRASGDYIILIGDDDTILPDVINVAKWAKDSGWDAVSPLGVPSYVWPDARHWFFGANLARNIYFLPFYGEISAAEPVKAVHECLKHAGQGVLNLPKIYHGIVKRQCFEHIRERTGSYFRGASPDVYGAIALGAVVQKYCHIDFPLSIAGIGGSSNSGRAALKQHKGELKTDPHMAAFSGLTWPKEVPDFFSVETVWAEAAIEAMHAFMADSSLFNVDYLYAKCLLNHPRESVRILRQYFTVDFDECFQKPRLVGLLYQLLRLIYAKLSHAFYRGMRPTRRGWQKELFGGEDINMASENFKDWLKSSGIKPKLI